MMAVGEETGKMSEMLERLAVFYEEEVTEATKDILHSHRADFDDFHRRSSRLLRPFYDKTDVFHDERDMRIT